MELFIAAFIVNWLVGIGLWLWVMHTVEHLTQRDVDKAVERHGLGEVHYALNGYDGLKDKPFFMLFICILLPAAVVSGYVSKALHGKAR